MSDIKEAIYSLLQSNASIVSLVGNKIRPQWTTMNTSAPYIIYERSNNETTRTLDGGKTDLLQDTINFVVYADSQTEVEDLADLAIATLSGISRQTYSGVLLIHGFQQSENDDMDLPEAGEQTPAFFINFSFNIWHR